MDKNRNDNAVNAAVESEDDYSMENEVCCSPEFPQGCVSFDEDGD